LPQRHRIAVASIVVAACASLALAGCSSSKSDKGSNQGGGGSASTTPSASSSLASLVPAAVKSKGTLTVAMDATYPPDESIAKDGKTIEGFDVDFIKAVAAKLGLKTNLVNVTFDSIIPRIQSGQYDIGMSSFTDSKEREKTVDFVTYFQAGEGFYVKAGSSKKFTTLDSLCNAKVAVENGTTELDDANAQGKKCKVTVLAFADQNQANLAVSSGRADVGFVDSQVAGYIVKQSNGQFEVSGEAFAVAPYGIALPKGNGMAPAVQAAVKAMIADGSYMQLLTKWGVQDGAIKDSVINGAIS
jgi:polar amino acid transport system substrate-binding protein